VGQVCDDFSCGLRSAEQREAKATGKLEGMSRNGGAQGQHPPTTASGDRLAVIASHLSHSWLGSPAHMASEKEAALAPEPVDGPTIFDKIIRKEIPSQVVYEDQKVILSVLSGSSP